MKNWKDTRILSLFKISVPIVQAPLAGAGGVDMAVAVARAGALGSLPCAMLTPEQIAGQVQQFRASVRASLNLNFFCHKPPVSDPQRQAQWRTCLKPYYEELGISLDAQAPAVNRAPFDATICAVVEECKPEVVSFHFGLPNPILLNRVRATGAVIISSATTVQEAVWLQERGVDAIIAMGIEAGGHRGMFLSQTNESQVGTLALVPQIVDAVKVPVIAAGGIGDGRGLVAALALGASAVQIGTAYMLSSQSLISAQHRAALKHATEADTALTNLFSGRSARGIVNRLMREIGPMNSCAPEFPLAGGALAPLRAKTEPTGSTDFVSLWSGQAGRFAVEESAEAITQRIAKEALDRIAYLTL